MQAIIRAFIVLTHRDIWWAEFFSALGLIIWAMVSMLRPEHLSESNFWPLLQVAPESVWEAVSLLVGLGQFAALCLDLQWLRATFAFMATWLVGALVINFLHLNHWPSGAIGYYFSSLCANNLALWRNIIRPRYQA